MVRCIVTCYYAEAREVGFAWTSDFILARPLHSYDERSDSERTNILHFRLEEELNYQSPNTANS